MPNSIQSVVTRYWPIFHLSPASCHGIPQRQLGRKTRAFFDERMERSMLVDYLAIHFDGPPGAQQFHALRFLEHMIFAAANVCKTSFRKKVHFMIVSASYYL